jgi:hypothetical protein
MTVIAKSLDLSTDTVKNIARIPEVVELTASLREKYRLRGLERMGGLVEKAWDLTEQTLEQKDAQAFMRMTAGMSNLSRISEAGERQQVEVSGIPGEQNPKIEIKNLLLQLFPNVSGQPTGQPKSLNGN